MIRSIMSIRILNDQIVVRQQACQSSKPHLCPTSNARHSVSSECLKSKKHHHPHYISVILISHIFISSITSILHIVYKIFHRRHLYLTHLDLKYHILDISSQASWSEPLAMLVPTLPLLDNISCRSQPGFHWRLMSHALYVSFFFGLQ